MRLARLRSRTLLLAVAVAALALGAFQAGRRRARCLLEVEILEAYRSRFLEEAQRHEADAAGGRDSVGRCLLEQAEEAAGMGLRATPEQAEWRILLLEDFIRKREHDAEMALQHAREPCEAAARLARLAERYRHVARYPWLPMPRGPE